MVERVVAVKCRVSDLYGRYVHKDGTAPSYIETAFGEVSRANIIAAVVSKGGPRSIVVDDGSGHIEARSFDDEKLFAKASPGDIVLLVGRPRKYQDQTYIVAEICRKLDTPKWLELRRAELAHAGPVLTNHHSAPAHSQATSKPEKAAPKQAVKAPDPVEERKEAQAHVTSTDNVLAIIRELDSGPGADVTKVVAKAGGAVEKILHTLLSEGEIFEIRPGKVKVLE